MRMPPNSPGTKDALEALGERNILMWLVAPHIAQAVREFFDRIGIEYTEVHEAHLRRVAGRHGIEIDPLVRKQSGICNSERNGVTKGRAQTEPHSTITIYCHACCTRSGTSRKSLR